MLAKIAKGEGEVVLFTSGNVESTLHGVPPSF